MGRWATPRHHFDQFDLSPAVLPNPSRRLTVSGLPRTTTSMPGTSIAVNSPPNMAWYGERVVDARHRERELVDRSETELGVHTR